MRIPLESKLKMIQKWLNIIRRKKSSMLTIQGNTLPQQGKEIEAGIQSPLEGMEKWILDPTKRQI